MDLKKRLNKQNFYLYDSLYNDQETVEDLIDDILKWGITFYYKNVEYYIDWWDTHDNWGIQTNSSHNEKHGIPWSIIEFHNDKESFIKVLETFRLHDGMLLYDALTKRGHWKYFLYDADQNWDKPTKK